MNKIKLIRYIKDNGLECDINQLSVNTGVAVERIQQVIKGNKLGDYVKSVWDNMAMDLTDHISGHYTITGLAEKYDIRYLTLWRYVRDKNLQHLFSRRRRHGTAYYNRINVLLEMLREMPILEVSRIADKKRLRPASRQGLYDLCEVYGVTPLKMKRKMKKKNVTI